jgi:hypothetical protein
MLKTPLWRSNIGPIVTDEDITLVAIIQPLKGAERQNNTRTYTCLSLTKALQGGV